MGQTSTARFKLRFAALAALAASSAAAQPAAADLRLDWRRIGNAALDQASAGLTTGAVDEVWFADGLLVVRGASGRLFESADLESWKSRANPALKPVLAEVRGVTGPQSGAKVVRAPLAPARFYAAGADAWRSDDGGRNWRNLTGWKGSSLLGGKLRDIAVSPDNPDEIVAAAESGVWRSVDGGLSWSDLNTGLPNLRVRRIAMLPAGSRGARIVAGQDQQEFEWAPGEKRAWRKTARPDSEAAVRRALSGMLATEITAFASSGDSVYAGGRDGRLWMSANGGREWSAPTESFGGPVEAIFADSRFGRRVALAAVAGRSQVLRTSNGGLFWDNLTANLPAGGAHGVTADLGSNTIYAATDGGLYMSATDLNTAGPPGAWVQLRGASMPEGKAWDVKLDAAGNQIYAAIDGYGVYAAIAPHRRNSFRAVSSADGAVRAAAPGSLLSILGGAMQSVRAGNANVPILASSESETQVQIPFEVTGTALSLALESRAGRTSLPVPLETAAPGIFADRDGTPMILDADAGVTLDAMTPARSGQRIQILTTGMGRVVPAWPTGVAAPADDPPKVAAPVKVYLDRVELEVVRATLAPRFIGFYLIEVRLPDLVNAGPAELYVTADGAESNRVRLYVEP